ncbi:MAG: hypothetical protein ACI88C_002288 [Acidimicrobiales bacterium]|jgi:hypothetical protein
MAAAWHSRQLDKWPSLAGFGVVSHRWWRADVCEVGTVLTLVKKFLVTQQFDASSQVVHQAFRCEQTWRSFAGLPFVGDPVVQSFIGGEPTTIATAYRVSIGLPAPADKFIDADKMTFVEVTTLQADGSGTFDIVPDHYDKLLSAFGRIEMVPFDQGCCERLIHGSVDVNLGWSGKFFEGPVEDAIVTGLTQALVAQANQIVLPVT